MTTYFVDTSALAKRYIPETGSQWILGWILPGTRNTTVISELSSVEMFSLVMRRQREGTLSTNHATTVRTNFLVHVEREYLVVPLETAVLAEARRLITIYPLRTLDAIQLASAIGAVTFLNVAMTFISADNNLLRAAASEGFPVDNPNNHP